MSIEVRTVAASEFVDWHRAVNTGFLREPTSPAELVEARRAAADLARTRGAFAAGRCVATFRSFPQELTVPGGAAVTTDAISNVTVSPTHRRRGLLSRMMSADLAAARERGDILATLVASEFPIYGRYGFGPATTYTEWTVDVPRTGLDRRRSGPGDGGTVELVGLDEVRKEGPAFHDRFRRSTVGAIDRSAGWWARFTGQEPSPHPWTEPFTAVYRSAAGEVEGMAHYAAQDDWLPSKQPGDTLTVRSLTAVSTAAERALWHYLCSIDWITTVKSGGRSPDDLLPLLLPDRRAAHVTTQADFLWVRILDTARALASRTYATPVTLVLDVVDEAGLAGGRYRLDASPDGADCVPTTESADLSVDVGALGSVYLGDETFARLVALGRATARSEGAVARADLAFRTARRPWCPDIF